MGTETSRNVPTLRVYVEFVKLNNPQMGTETYEWKFAYHLSKFPS